MGSEEIKPKKKGKKKKKIVVSLVNCCYPIVKNAVKNRPGWRTAEPGEPWDVGWSDTNWVVREVREMRMVRMMREMREMREMRMILNLNFHQPLKSLTNHPSRNQKNGNNRKIRNTTNASSSRSSTVDSSQPSRTMEDLDSENTASRSPG